MRVLGKEDIKTDAVMEVSGIITLGRDYVLDSFLASDCRKLFWLDCDMVFDPASFFRLLYLSTKRAVVCAAYPSRQGDEQFYIYHEGQMKIDQLGLCEIKGAGLGFTVMDRKVAEKLVEDKPLTHVAVKNRVIRQVFRTGNVNGEFMSEDICFFEDIRKLGYKVWCDPSIELGHMGENEWRARLLDKMEKVE